jgi:MFS family permease
MSDPGRTLWRHRDFLLLWVGQGISELGSAVTQLAMPLTAILVLRASTLQVGLLTAATTAAFLIIALPAGVVVDRTAKRKVMLACDIGRMAVIGSVPLAAAFGALTLGQLYGVALTAGVLTVFFDVAYQSYLPVLVRTDQLVDANGKLSAAAALAQVAGPGTSGALVGVLGAGGAMIADAVSYAVSVASLLLIRAPEPRLERLEVRPRFRQELTAGLSFIARDAILRKIVACTGTANLFAGIAYSLLILFMIRVLHVRAAETGLVVALAALGAVAGAVVSGPLSRLIGTARLIWVSMLGFGAIVLLTPAARPGWSTALCIVGWAGNGFSAELYNVAQVSYRQAICPPEMLGRMNSALRWIVWGTLPFGAVLGGTLGSVLGIRGGLWIAAAGLWAAGLWVFFSPLRTMRDVPVPLQVAPPDPVNPT